MQCGILEELAEGRCGLVKIVFIQHDTSAT